MRTQAKAEQKSERVPTAKRGKGAWIAAGAAVVLCAGAAVWVAGNSDSNLAVISAPQPVAEAAPSVSTAASTAASNAATASASAVIAAADADVPVAAILDEAPAPAAKQESLRDMLSAPAKAETAQAPDHDELSKLLESTPAAVKPAKAGVKEKKEAHKDDKQQREKAQKAQKAEKAEKDDKKDDRKDARASRGKETKLAEKSEKAEKAAKIKREQKEKAEKAHEIRLAKKKEAAKLAAAKSTPAKTAAQKQADDDVTLLAALVAHSHRDNAAHAAAKNKFKQCKTLAADAAEQCRARLCAAGAREEPECKPARLVKATSTP